MSRLRVVLVLVLAATLAAALYAPAPQDDVVAPSERRAGAAASPSPDTPAAAPVDVLELHARRAADDVPGAFGPLPSPAPVPVRAAEAPPAPPPPPPPPPAPPFRVLGRYVDEAGAAVFLQQGDRALVARVGDLLDGRYRVESLSAAGLTLIALPTNQQHTLPIGETP